MKQSNKGFSLVEILVAMAMITLGLLAVVSLQTELINKSGGNKAHNEALALAQQRLDEFRNYTTSITSEADFTATYAITSATVEESITGINTVFTRGYDITGNTGDSTRDIHVAVSWTDRKGTPQNVSLNTKVAWEDPAAIGRIGKIHGAI